MEVLETTSMAINDQMLIESVASTMIVVIVILGLWTIPWKIIALWRSARNGHKVWFGFIFFLNTVGILEIIYILTAGKKKKK